MSIQIPCGIRAPLNNGFTIGDPETENGRVFRYFAYRHPDCQDIWFAAEAQSEREVEGLRCMVGVISPVKKRKMPPKPDANIWAIPDYEYKRLVSLEWLVGLTIRNQADL